MDTNLIPIKLLSIQLIVQIWALFKAKCNTKDEMYREKLIRTCTSLAFRDHLLKSLSIVADEKARMLERDESEERVIHQAKSSLSGLEKKISSLKKELHELESKKTFEINKKEEELQRVTSELSLVKQVTLFRIDSQRMESESKKEQRKAKERVEEYQTFVQEELDQRWEKLKKAEEEFELRQKRQHQLEREQQQSLVLLQKEIQSLKEEQQTSQVLLQDKQKLIKSLEERIDELENDKEQKGHSDPNVILDELRHVKDSVDTLHGIVSFQTELMMKTMTFSQFMDSFAKS